MTTDAKWTVGTGIALAGLIVGLHVATAARIGEVERRLDQRIGGVERRLDQRIDRIEDRLDGFGARLRAVEVAFAKVDQRLETIERAVIPSAGPEDD